MCNYDAVCGSCDSQCVTMMLCVALVVRNSIRCVDYLRVSRGSYGSTEYCGKEIDQSDSANSLEFGKV